MDYPFGDERVTGLLVPLAALRSDESIGCGEYADLPGLGQWCVACGIRLIQLLPINDTGSQSSPYSALSAFGLHPIYLRVESLPEINALPATGAADLADTAQRARERHRDAVRFDYAAVLADKMALLRHLYDAAKAKDNAEIDAFVAKNEWVAAYALFCARKEENDKKPWTEWNSGTAPDGEAIHRAFRGAEHGPVARFFAWLQLRCAEQLRSAVGALETQGIALKGDLPILMNEDSADVWSERDVFMPELRAGAPPDMFSELGQNWDFPIYCWSILEQRNYSWWKRRLSSSAAYYNAYRIDHVLGFFRIWAIPAGNESGILGFFWPQEGMTVDELRSLGFDQGRIRWLAEPHVEGYRIRERFGDDWTGTLGSIFVQVAEEDLFTFAPAIRGESDIRRLPCADDQRETLLAWFRDRALVELPDGRFAETWNFRSCSRYASLFEEERDRFESLVREKHDRNDALWEREGRKLLEELTGSTEMLACAEDLGVVPPSVPRTLESLTILGLRIPRWTRRWDTEGQPMVPIEEYPELTVAAPSVHDTSTLRGWWETESGREELWSLTGAEGPCPATYDAGTAAEVLRFLAQTASRIFVVQIQDLFALTGIGCEGPAREERVNVPGTYNDFNWTYRMPLTIEELKSDATLTTAIRQISLVRAQ